jgi:dethiobiotin synthetase
VTGDKNPHRPAHRTKGYFVTGTDTGVGKTRSATALLHAFSMRGLRAVGMKPVAAGAEDEAGTLINDDVTALLRASSVAAPHALVNPYCFAPAIAPHLAAAEAGISIDFARIKAACLELMALADVVVVEGAGGFCVPLGRGVGMDRVAREIGFPVILVVGMRLGCLNHALLTAAAVRATGLPLIGWVANHIDPAMERADANVATLEQELGVPLLARCRHAETCDPAVLAREFAIDELQLASEP